jgi:MFS family permease
VKVHIDTSELGQSRWYEYLVRFAFGGTVTALAGVVAKRYGPEVGGLFLAFPAIFPAAATLIADHEEKKEGRATSGADRATVAAGLDAIGAAFGAFGLVMFAVVIWRGLPTYNLSIVLPSALLAWAVTSILCWQLWEILRTHARKKRLRGSATKLDAHAHAVQATKRRMK